ncbi:regulation of nuclear pre-mRNA domain-containing protein 2 isoform X2 [Ascaphus truei]|uniref:regulation of nuclear pre-mRNA domain-containing protein 2 isoform X2 n=1 Tax=Ascaphus truei TaxID=8439 RepID=UPI003F5AB822
MAEGIVNKHKRQQLEERDSDKMWRAATFPHRLNLFYVANDVIQNCKRRNAVVYRETFAEVLPEAASLVKDPSVSKSVERIFKIWEERNVYPEDTVATFKSALSGGGWGKRERNKSVRPKVADKEAEAPPVNPKAVLKSKIVAEFRPQTLIDDLFAYKRSVDHIDLKEKQLSSMRVDVCSTETLKRLKDKAGGKKFSKDFEEASAKLEEFVNVLDKQVKNGPPITEAIENAGIFYEAQYKEVKVVANAYKTFANRVSNLKKKLDQLKATLPDPQESPVPSPTLDAPSPTGSESPFQGMGDESPLSPELDTIQAASPDPPKDNRIVEDMELSDVDADEEMPTIIVEERKEHSSTSSAPSKVTDSVSTSGSTASTTLTGLATTVSAPTPAPLTASIPNTPPPVPVSTSTPVSAPAPTSVMPAKTVTTSTITPSASLALPNLANVDLGKISSILSSLTSVMKGTGVSPAAKPSPGTPTTPTTNVTGGMKPHVQGAPNPLANLLSKVEITPESILSALSKTQGPSTQSLQGLSSLFQSVAGNSVLSSGALTHSPSTAPANTTVSTVKDRNAPSGTPFVSKSLGYSPSSSNSEVSSTSVCKTSVGNSSNFNSSLKQPGNSLGFSSEPLLSTEKSMSQSPEVSKPTEETESTTPSSLEMKIHNFLKGNPGFSGLNLNIPILSGLGSNTVSETQSSEFHSGPTSTSLDNVDGTPVRDERSGTPTQDEMMDKPTSSNVDTMSLLSKIIGSGSSTPSSTRSPPPLSKDTDFQKLPNMPSYRSFGLGGNSPTAYRQPSDTIEKQSSLIGSPREKFFPDTSFQEDEDYRNFEYCGAPPSAMGNLEKESTKSTLTSSAHLESSEYQPALSSFSQSQDFGRQSFPQSMRSIFNTAESCGQLSPSSEMYGRYSLRGGNMEPDGSPSKDNPFFPPDSNHNSLLLHSGMPQTQYPDSPHSLHRITHTFPTQNLSASSRMPILNVEQSGSSISASSTIEFKNMLKNASRRPSDEKQFGQTCKGSLNEDVHTGISSEERQRQEEHYRIETRVSSSCIDLPDSTEEKGAPIETLGYHNSGNMRLSGEPIKTVESIRVGVKGSRGHGRGEGRVGWFEMGSAGSSFDNGPLTAEQPSISGSSGVPGFKTQYEEHLSRFPDAVNDFRTKSFQSFEHHLPPPPLPPPMVAPIERGGPFQIEQVGHPSGPRPGLPPDHGSLFPRDLPVPSRMSSMEAPNPLPHGSHPPPIEHGGNTFSGHPPPEHGGIPFSPPLLDIGNPFSKEHSAIHQGAMKEHFGMHTGPARDHGVPPRDHNGPPHGRVNETLASHSRDHHGPHGGPPPPLIAPHHRDNINRGGMRNPRPQFRPREPYHSLKRPRPPFGRGPQFFAPKRPFYPPRY